MTERFYAVRPHNATLEDWTEEEIEELNDHVRHMLHSRRNKMKRRFKAFGQYVRRPLGFLVTLYATLITLFGLAWVLFLIGWIYVGERQLYVINVIDTVLVSLFAIVGDGLIPWRIVDTYHMWHIAHYHRLTWKLRKKMELPHLQDKNDLPSEPAAAAAGSSEDVAADVEAARTMHEKEELTVLTVAQQRKLEHHQAKFCKSHTFYKPHETETHYAFPLRLLVAIVVLLDCHSIFQLGLGLCTWCIDYHVRPAALTATLLCFSLGANITSGVLILVGDRRTRKKDVIERMFRQELTQEAMKRVNKAKAKEAIPQEEGKDEGNENENEGGARKIARALQRQLLQSQQQPPPSSSSTARLERIDEGKESGRSSRDFQFPLRPKIDSFLRRSGDRARSSSADGWSASTLLSSTSPRKSADRAGRFSTTPTTQTTKTTTTTTTAGSSSSSSSRSSQGDGPRIAGTFPEEEEEEEEREGINEENRGASERENEKEKEGTRDLTRDRL